VDYVLKLTLTPWEMTEQDVGLLRDAGLDDSEILDVCQVASYYAFVNRIAQGLGVELEDGDGVETTTTSPPGPAGRG
jgi:alkylhydroperoxidase family enzyme